MYDNLSYINKDNIQNSFSERSKNISPSEHQMHYLQSNIATSENIIAGYYNLILHVKQTNFLFTLFFFHEFY